VHLRDRFRTARPSPAMIVALIALFVALGGVAVGAGSPFGGTSSDKQIRGCVSKSGALTIPKGNRRCARGQTEITWNKRGPRGLQGEQGLKGDAGAPGTPGTPGTPGERGFAGPTGPAGADGAAGPTGPRGPTGPAGPTGPRGPTGPAGP
jgi:hypothetical protein